MVLREQFDETQENDRKRRRREQPHNVHLAQELGVVPPLPPYLGAMPGHIQPSIFSLRFQPAIAAVAGGDYVADGLICMPHRRGGTIIRTVLVPALKTYTVSQNFFSVTYAVLIPNIEFAAATMIPVGVDLQPVTTAPNFIGLYHHVRPIAGYFSISSNGSSDLVITGDVSGGWVPDSRELYDFDPAKIASRAVFPKDTVLNEKIAKGLTCRYPALSPPFSSGQEKVSRPRGQLVSSTLAAAVTSSTIGTFYISHLTTCTNAGVVNVTCGNIPWGTVPDFTLTITGTNASNPPTPVQKYVRVTYMYAHVASAGVRVCTTCKEITYGYTTGAKNSTKLEISSPADSINEANQMWVGTLFRFDDNASPSDNFTIDTWLSYETEAETNNLFMCRVDNASPNVGLAVDGKWWPQVQQTGQDATFVKATPMQEEYTLQDQHEHALDYLGDGAVHRTVFPGRPQ